MAGVKNDVMKKSAEYIMRITSILSLKTRGAAAPKLTRTPFAASLGFNIYIRNTNDGGRLSVLNLINNNGKTSLTKAS